MVGHAMLRALSAINRNSSALTNMECFDEPQILYNNPADIHLGTHSQRIKVTRHKL